MPLTVEILAAALARCAERLEAVAPELNERDGQLGDGDLGSTLTKCAANVRAALPRLGDDLGSAFGACAQACAKASGSSFGTLMAIALLSASKRCAGRATLPWLETPDLLQDAFDAMAARGGAALGDKTVLDTVAAAAAAMRGLDDPGRQSRAAGAAVSAALAEFRSKPNQIGRARMFAQRSIGMDDPGMVAFAYMLDACGGSAPAAAIPPLAHD